MIKSMTGFASRTDELEQATVGVTVRSVNHRYLDIQIRLPQSLAAAESRVRTAVQQRMARGRVEVTINVQSRRPPGVEVELNEPLVNALNEALGRARASGLVSGQLQTSDLIRLPQALIIRESSQVADSGETEALQRGVEGAVESAVTDLDTMRVREGEHLRHDLDGRLDGVAALLERIAAAAEDGREALEARLRQRIDELPADVRGDTTAVAQEIVRIAARSDISEEVVRFRAHVSQWRVLQDSDEPCGRKLDFLLQEMNREVNTIGSKADGIESTRMIVEMKAELEKMREQVQNVE